MKIHAVFVAVLGGLSSACSPSEEARMLREGIGTELTRQDIAAATQAQTAYLGYLCQQAGLPTIRTAHAVRCSDDAPGGRMWPVVVQAGLNDIDERCDAYLAWLDDKRRSRAPTISQINALQTTTTSIMRFTGATANPISIAGEAFGLASSTFTNFNSRLILEVNHSTVQAVVVNRRNDYRLRIVGVPIDNRPAAVHALRSYLNICMPFTIEMEINTTVTAFQFGGPSALDRPAPNTPWTVQAASYATAPKPRDPLTKQTRVTFPANAEYATFIQDYNPAVHTPTYVRQIQAALCITWADPPGLPATRRHVQYFKNSGYSPQPGTKLTKRDIELILSLKAGCTVSLGANYYERSIFPDQLAVQNFATALGKVVPTLMPDASTSQIRDAIRAYREMPENRGKFGDLPKEMWNQVTPELYSMIARPKN